jgi:Sporulation and spore germination
MPRHIKIGLIILAVGFTISLGFFVDVVGRIRSMVNEKETSENPFVPPVAPLFKPEDPPMPVKIFYPTRDRSILLSSEEQTIFQSAELVNRAKQIVQKLQDGPVSSALAPALPKDAKMEELFIADNGTAFIDFTNTITTNHSGGILNEQATIYAIVNSLTYNLPQIQDVKILIGGTEKETLAGHVLLLLPLQMDLSITDVTAPERPGERSVGALNP